jgi:hypothetical protein
MTNLLAQQTRQGVKDATRRDRNDDFDSSRRLRPSTLAGQHENGDCNNRGYAELQELPETQPHGVAPNDYGLACAAQSQSKPAREASMVAGGKSVSRFCHCAQPY